MAEQVAKNTVREILELLEQQRELLRSEKPITEEQAQLYRERLAKIRDLIEQLGEAKIGNRDNWEPRLR